MSWNTGIPQLTGYIMDKGMEMLEYEILYTTLDVNCTHHHSNDYLASVSWMSVNGYEQRSTDTGYLWQNLNVQI